MKERRQNRKIRVLIVDDHAMMRSVLRDIIGGERDLVVAAEAGSGPDALESLPSAKPDVFLMDTSMPEMNGMEATRRLLQLQPDLKVLGLSLYAQTSYLEEMIAAGASGYALKTGSPWDIVKAIRIVADGGTYWEPAIPRHKRAAGRKRAPTAALSSEEMQVAKLFAKGRTKMSIADSLGLTVSEVDAKRMAAMGKLGLRTRAQLVRLARERGWLEN